MAPAAQKPLVGDFAWPAFNPPQNSSRPSHHPHSHYESPFQQIDLRPSVIQSATDFLTQQLAAINAYLSRQPPVLIVLAVACIISLLGLTVFLCAARSCLEKQQRLHECRHHFSDDGGDDDGGRLTLVAGEKGGHAPARGADGSPAETYRDFGFEAAGRTGGASVKHNLPFHVSAYL